MKIASFDGKEINVYVWDEVKEPLATVQIVHGMAEHAGKYEEFASYLNSLGYVVYADDHRGHGLTDKDTLGYSKGDMFYDTVKDEGIIADEIARKYAGVKHILFAHSYGSFIAQQLISSYAEKFDAAVLYGSNYKKDAETYLGAFIADMGCFFKGAEKPGNLLKDLTFGAYERKFADGRWLSSRYAYTDEYNADELCGFVCSYNFYRSFLKALTKLYTESYASGLNKNMPLLIISGADDPVGAMGKGVEKLKEYYLSCGMKDVALHLINGARHVLLQEKEDYKKDFLNVVTAFVDRIVAGK